MHPLALIPRARAILSVPALVALGCLGGCTNPGVQLQQFGVVGTFAEDCSRSVADGGARAIYELGPPGGYPTFTAVNRYGIFRSKIVRVDRVNPDTLILYTDDPGGAWNEIDMRRVDNGFVTTRMISHKPNDYRPLVAVGGPGGNAGGEGLFVQRCAE
jgi:hypothetical protein